ncbi:50S ribosomal protein L2 [Kiritimatiella glycovorans]|uniref:Large ribosomal subunit protein uL2 n=1 Tax=Kiritimatiella glycovorans TaxID=1307763 RepID=A0A0G3ELE7_9BACT|nr:50S ribosomal protein L2 [Kiritimatiella glycovorans]AKJ64954.1 50S ribosomal protein L2 [Kiritimatiella glycovorans]
MGLKKYRPVTPSRRFMVLSDFQEVTKDRPERSLLVSKKRGSGRSRSGRITVRHRGGGHKRRLRQVDFKRDKHGIPAKVAAIEYDPNRSARLALLHYRDGEKRYILAPAGLKPGAEIVSGPGSEPAAGNALPLAEIPIGMPIHNIELNPGNGGKIVRSAGESARIMAREGRYANVKLPSGEIRKVPVESLATVGAVGFAEHENLMSGKAGRKRWKGVRPTVRGVVMNPVDHPMGGGEGRTSGGGHPTSPWGQLAKSGKTRRGKKATDKFIVKRRS